MSANQQVLLSAGGVKKQGEFTTPGVHSFVVPAGVTSVSIVAVGGGGAAQNRTGGGGGALAYRNNLAVTPGETLSIIVGAPGRTYSSTLENATDSSVTRVSNSTVLLLAAKAQGQSPGLAANCAGYTAAFSGGSGGSGAGTGTAGAGGGAAGYAGDGGNGANVGSDANSGAAGSGGGGGGGTGNSDSNVTGAGGCGVGIYGQGASGAGGYANYGAGLGGSGGTGGAGGNYALSPGQGGYYGGGCGGRGSGTPSGTVMTAGGGAVRIIRPGNLRQFPSTRTADE